MSRFLVLGVSGMAGHVISIYLSEQGHDVTGFTRRPIDFVENITGDARNESLLETIINDGSYDVVINAIGILNQEAEAHKDTAVFLNGYLPHRLASLTEKTKTRVFHMSTDCVFAGNTGPYAEDSIADGRSFYDRSKAIGELRDDKNLTFRNSIVGPDINPDGIGLFNWFMKQNETINGFTKAMWTGVTTLELAKAMEFLAEDGSSGLVNMVPEGNISKFDLLGLFNTYFKNSTIEIKPSEQLLLDKTLVRTNFDSDFRPKPYNRQVEEMANWVYRHKKLYPHYGSEL